MDNLLTNTVLFRELKKIGIGACGTTRATSSKDFPADLSNIIECVLVQVMASIEA